MPTTSPRSTRTARLPEPGAPVTGPTVPDQAHYPNGLFAHGRGLIALDQPRSHTDELLRRARLPATDANRTGLSTLVLSTPGLDRVISGVLLDSATLNGAAGSATMDGSGMIDRLLGNPRIALGIQMGDETTELRDIDHVTRDIGQHLAAGVSFARWRLVASDGRDPADVAARARLAACWAAICQRSALTPLIECTVRIPARQRLDEAERLHRTAVAAVTAEMRTAGVDLTKVLWTVNPVVPGRRSSRIATSEDVARATIRSLRHAGVNPAAGVALTPGDQPLQFTAHLAAVQGIGAGWPLGFCLGRSLLDPIARVWRGRPDRVHAAQRELRARLTSAVTVLRAGLDEAGCRGRETWWGSDEASHPELSPSDPDPQVMISYGFRRL